MHSSCLKSPPCGSRALYSCDGVNAAPQSQDSSGRLDGPSQYPASGRSAPRTPANPCRRAGLSAHHLDSSGGAGLGARSPSPAGGCVATREAPLQAPGRPLLHLTSLRRRTAP
jgi:hypothetical protein